MLFTAVVGVVSVVVLFTAVVGAIVLFTAVVVMINDDAVAVGKDVVSMLLLLLLTRQ